MVYLRQLQEKDAPLMLEWMHDPQTQKAFNRDMLSMTLEKARSFCISSVIPQRIENGQSLHFAITEENDEYLGTISLKDFDLKNSHAEYAIVLRSSARGRGVAEAATRLIVEKAFREYGLHKVFLTVLSNNKKAITLYEKCGFVREACLKEHIYSDGQYIDWYMYGIINN